jgi:ribonuclease HI
VLILTDSQYAIKCVTVWYQAWVKNNWITSVGRPVENRDLVEVIVGLMQDRRKQGADTRLEWVKGHEGDVGNEGADRLAVEGARRGRV